ncbi:MAG: hypothetical protein INF93_11430 [Rhodobacter sp.]|jgi:hypothetical protein|nr:hypothetical protein [Rhodobacter sp.]
MDDEIWFDPLDAIQELGRLSQVEVLFMDAAWQKAYRSRQEWAKFSSEENFNFSEDQLDDLERSERLQVEMLNQTYLRAHLVMSYSIFEKGIVSLSSRGFSYVMREIPPKKGPKSGFDFTRDLLERCDLKKTIHSEDWDKADALRKIRNVVAHSASILESPKDKNNFENWKVKFFGISTRPFGSEDSQLNQIWLEAYLVRYASDVFRGVLEFMKNEIESRLNASS